MICHKIVYVINKSLTPRKFLQVYNWKNSRPRFLLALRGICGSKNIGWAEAGPDSVGTLC